MTNQSPKISVIVPVYNVQKYLSRCIDSILAQTFTDFELLLIDDGSKDNSGKICDEYAKKDTRIQVFHKENGGVSSARNLGLYNAMGEWIAFIDSDDFIEVNYLYNLIKLIICNKQLIMVGYKSFGTNNNSFHRFKCQTLNKDNLIKYIFTEKLLIYYASPWGKLYNHQILKDNKIIFPLDVSWGEDRIFNILYIYMIDKLSLSDTIDYNYNTTNALSLSHKINDFSSEWQSFIELKKALLQLIECHPSLYKDPYIQIWNNGGLNAHLSRCFTSIYKRSNKYTISKQITILKSIPDNDYNDFCQYYKCSGLKSKLNKFLLKKKMYYFFLLFNRIYKNNTF